MKFCYSSSEFSAPPSCCCSSSSSSRSSSGSQSTIGTRRKEVKTLAASRLILTLRDVTRYSRRRIPPRPQRSRRSRSRAYAVRDGTFAPLATFGCPVVVDVLEEYFGLGLRHGEPEGDGGRGKLLFFSRLTYLSLFWFGGLLALVLGV